MGRTTTRVSKSALVTHRLTVGHSQGGPRFWMNVAIYDTVIEMRAAAHKHRPCPDNWDAMGCFTVGPHDNPRYLGILRLCREHLTPAIVIHESVHAAVAFTAKSESVSRVHLDPHAGGVQAEREETLAYATHGIAAALLDYLGLTK